MHHASYLTTQLLTTFIHASDLYAPHVPMHRYHAAHHATSLRLLNAATQTLPLSTPLAVYAPTLLKK